MAPKHPVRRPPRFHLFEAKPQLQTVTIEARRQLERQVSHFVAMVGLAEIRLDADTGPCRRSRNCSVRHRLHRKD